MTARALHGLLGGLVAFTATAAAAQEETDNRVAAETDWSVFVAEEPRECFAVSAPKDTVITEDGEVVEARRGDIRLFVSYRPESDVSGEVSFNGGYPFADDSTVTVDIGGSNFDLFTEGESAWPASPAKDAELVEAMKGGVEAEVTGRSSRGKTTEDTFSLMGFTAAVETAAERCQSQG